MADSYTLEDVSYKSDIHRYLEGKAYSDFLDRAVTQEEVTYISLTLPVQTADPLVCLRDLSKAGEFQFFWEIARDKLSVAAGRALITIKGQGQDRFTQVRDEMKQIRGRTLEFSTRPCAYTGLNFLGGFAFDDEADDPQWKAYGPASFFVPEWMIVKDESHSYLTLTFDISAHTSRLQLQNDVHSRIQTIIERLPSESDTIHSGFTGNKQAQKLPFSKPSSTYTRWQTSVAKAKSYIKNKRFDKIVLAREHQVEMQDQLSPVHIINNLRQEYPNCYTFLIGWHGNKSFIGSSPERLAAFKNNMLLTEALAGSIQRGLTTPEDAALGKQLLNSTKDIGEHNFVIKAIEQNLESIASAVKRPNAPVIKKLANVQHLFTPVTARIDDTQDRISVLQKLHPTPAVGGYPWKAASNYISELEDFNRGWYAGPIGWLNGKGDGEFTVAIRSGLIEGNTARFYAGCGIVEDSDPDAEWRETSIKLIPMLSALRYD